MNIIQNDKNDVVAYLSDQLIVSASNNKLLGIILGHYVYNVHAKLIGIYSKKKIINTEGEAIATVELMTSKLEKDFFTKSYFKADAWSILQKIKNHVIPF